MCSKRSRSKDRDRESDYSKFQSCCYLSVSRRKQGLPGLEEREGGTVGGGRARRVDDVSPALPLHVRREATLDTALPDLTTHPHGPRARLRLQWMEHDSTRVLLQCLTSTSWINDHPPPYVTDTTHRPSPPRHRHALTSYNSNSTRFIPLNLERSS